METKKTYNIRLFYDLLNSHGAWERFKELRRADDEKWEYNYDLNNPDAWLFDAFPWDESFNWEDINDEWAEIIQY